MAGQPDYYALLGVRASATFEDIRAAYMKRALEAHPDRNPSPTATHEFQELADAYYTLSDGARRAEYDRRRGGSSAAPKDTPASGADADNVFGDVFEDMMRSEVRASAAWWSTLGLLGGATLGFVVANVPGAVVGGLAGKGLGAVRDRTGRPAYHVFKDLPHARKAQVLATLAAQVLSPR
ncbi:hypothetical protein LPJ61_003308 [Coemansia biformis]|uniref:J domain-containing protein n=1 Tax=Coemansia biformis TaxID=1286918 RepID=A0A9W8CWD9_9FUNG|nr:hypothetical protein LPJ61_003308 [Coemansia biformis]